MERADAKYYLKQFSRPVSMFALLVGFLGIILLIVGVTMVVRYSRMLASLQEIRDLSPSTATSSATVSQDSLLSLTAPTASPVSIATPATPAQATKLPIAVKPTEPAKPPQPPAPVRPAQPPKPVINEAPENSVLPARHTVVQGDSAWKLAERFYGKGELYPVIMKANNLSRQAWLKPGMALTIPAVDMSSKDYHISDVSVTTKGAETAPVSAEPKAEQTYTVQKGDTLWFIATKYVGPGSSWVKIYQRNKAVIGHNPHLIYPGTKLQLPASK